MSLIDYSALKMRVTMSEVLVLLNYEPRVRRGDQLRGGCPIHGSESPNSRIFSVNLAKNVFRCFKCGASGNQLDLWAQVHDICFYEASLRLCARLGIEPPGRES